MRKSTIILAMSLVVLTSFAIVIFQDAKATEMAKSTHSFTKAVCSEENFCEDYEIVCQKDRILSFRATGYTAKFPENWTDPRSEEDRAINCQ